MAESTDMTLHSSSTEPTLVRVPTRQPTITGRKYSPSSLRWLYTFRASTAVTGLSIRVSMLLPWR